MELNGICISLDFFFCLWRCDSVDMHNPVGRIEAVFCRRQFCNNSKRTLRHSTDIVVLVKFRTCVVTLLSSGFSLSCMSIAAVSELIEASKIGARKSSWPWPNAQWGPFFSQWRLSSVSWIQAEVFRCIRV